MSNNNFFQSRKFKKILYGVGATIIILMVFQTGMFVGYRKASFSYRWGDNYYRIFGKHHKGERIMGGRVTDFFHSGDLTNSSGSIGQIASIDLPSLTINNTDGTERMVLIADDTVIRRYRETINANDLKIGDFIVVIGAPNDSSQVEAKIIRIMPDHKNITGANVRNKQ